MDDLDIIPPHLPEGPTFEPIFYEKEIEERNSLNFTRQPLEIAIDDYFDFENGIAIEKEKLNVEDIYKEARRKNNAKNKKLGIPKKQTRIFPEREEPPTVKKKSTKYESTEAHNKGGWNTDTRTQGIFDADMKKNEIFQYRNQKKYAKDKKLKPKIIVQPKLATEDQNEKAGLYLTDVAQIEDLLAKENNQTLKAIAKTHERKLQNLENMLIEEQAKTEMQNKDFQDQYREMIKMQRQQKDVVNRMGYKSQHNLKRATKRPRARTLSKKKKNTGKRRGSSRPKLKYNAMSAIRGQNRKPKEKFENEWLNQLELMKEAIKGTEPTEFRESEYKQQSDKPRVRFEESYQKKSKTNRKPPQKFTSSQLKPLKTTPVNTLAKLTNPNLVVHPSFLKEQKRLEAIKEIKHNVHKMRQEDKIDQLARLEENLYDIRQDMRPIMEEINRKNNIYDKSSPHAELMAKSAGRLLKIHSEKLAEKIIDELMEESVNLLNFYEELQQRKEKENEIKDLALDMLREIDAININQKFINSGKPIITREMLQVSQPGHFNSGNESLPLRDFDSNFFKQKQLETNILKNGPYKLSNNYEDENKIQLNFNPNLLMLIKRDQYMAEDIIEETPSLNFMKSEYAEGMMNIGDYITNEVLNEVVREFGEIQENFVNEVIKSEFN